MPFELAQETTGNWMTGIFLCKIIEFLQGVGFAVNVLSVTFIALDRYFMLAKPFSWKQHTQVVKYVVGFCWIFPIILCSPYLYIYDVVRFPSLVERQVCSTISLPHKKLEVLYWGMEMYYLDVLPFIIISFCYIGILKHIAKLKLVGVSLKSNNSKQKQHDRIKVRSSYCALAVVAVFLVCWFPSFVLRCLRINLGSTSVPRTSVADEIALFMAYTNEAVNPFLYGYIDSNFKKYLRSSILCCC